LIALGRSGGPCELTPLFLTSLQLQSALIRTTPIAKSFPYKRFAANGALHIISALFCAFNGRLLSTLITTVTSAAVVTVVYQPIATADPRTLRVLNPMRFRA
jgi:hypothetical protein